MNTTSYILTEGGLNQFLQLRHEAVETVTRRFYAAHQAQYARFGERGRKACREDIEFHLNFLRPVLELGYLRPYTDYLKWFTEVLSTRNIPVDHIAETLLWLGEFFQKRIRGRDGKLIAEALSAALTDSQQPETPHDSERPHAVCSWQDVQPFEIALLQGDRRQCLAIVDRLLQQGHGPTEINVFLIQAALVNIGLKWQKNEISIAQEHLATATAQTVMADSYLRAKFPRPKGKKILLACVESNEHSVGARMVADAFEQEGWTVQYLGANTPTRALIGQITHWMPDMIGLSLSVAYQLGTAREAISAIRSQLGINCPPIIIGGQAVNRFPGVVQCVGANGIARDALTALQLSVVTECDHETA